MAEKSNNNNTYVETTDVSGHAGIVNKVDDRGAFT